MKHVHILHTFTLVYCIMINRTYTKLQKHVVYPFSIIYLRLKCKFQLNHYCLCLIDEALVSHLDPISDSFAKKLFHLTIFYACLIPFRITGLPKPIPAPIGRKAGYTLDGSPVHHSTKTSETYIVGESQSTQRELIHARGDHGKSTQKGHSRNLNQETS